MAMFVLSDLKRGIQSTNFLNEDINTLPDRKVNCKQVGLAFNIFILSRCQGGGFGNRFTNERFYTLVEAIPPWVSTVYFGMYQGSLGLCRLAVGLLG
jgi:hypothetical protein